MIAGFYWKQKAAVRLDIRSRITDVEINGKIMWK